MISLNELLTTVHGKVSGIREATEIFSAQLAPEFNAFRLLMPSERSLSNVLSDLLSPQGTHGQKAVFLKIFLSHFGFEGSSWAMPEKAIKVTTEALTFNGRRIDLRIDFEDGIIGVENKPWAQDQELQVADYIDDLERRHPKNRKLVYLSAHGDGPSDKSTGKGTDFVKDGALLVIAYKDLLPWLSCCKSVCQSHRVLAFLDEFHDYVSREILGENQMHEQKMIVSEITKSAANVEAAFMVGRTLNDVKAELMNLLWTQLREKFSRENPSWEMKPEFTNTDESKGRGLSVSFNPAARHMLRLSFDAANCRECIIGLAKTSEDKALDRPKVSELFQKKFPAEKQGKDSEKWWLWYRNFDPCSWEDRADVWSSVLSGVLAQKIFDELQEIYRILEAESLLCELE